GPAGTDRGSSFFLPRGKGPKLIFLMGRSRSDLGRSHGLCHSEEHDDSLAAAAGRERLLGRTDAALDILPIVHSPDIPRRANRDVGLHLQATTYVATWW